MADLYYNSRDEFIDSCAQDYSFRFMEACEDIEKPFVLRASTQALKEEELNSAVKRCLENPNNCEVPEGSSKKELLDKIKARLKMLSEALKLAGEPGFTDEQIEEIVLAIDERMPKWWTSPLFNRVVGVIQAGSSVLLILPSATLIAATPEFPPAGVAGVWLGYLTVDNWNAGLNKILYGEDVPTWTQQGATNLALYVFDPETAQWVGIAIDVVANLSGGIGGTLALRQVGNITLREKIISDLLADTNKRFPLTRVNGEKMLDLAPPRFRPKKAAGVGGEGGDLVFEGPQGQIFKIENKSTTSFGSFKDELSHAAQRQAKGNLVFIQVPEGTDAARWMSRFWGYRKDLINNPTPGNIAKLNVYKNTEIVIYDPNGVNLLPRQPIYNPPGN